MTGGSYGIRIGSSGVPWTEPPGQLQMPWQSHRITGLEESRSNDIVLARQRWAGYSDRIWYDVSFQFCC